jgi:phosphate starvation-inducible protein PhoH and related proteins
LSVEEIKIPLIGIDTMMFYGPQDTNIRALSNVLSVKLVARGNEILLKGEGENLQEAKRVISELILFLNRNDKLGPDDIHTIAKLSALQNSDNNNDHDLDSIILYTKNSEIKPRTDGQKKYFQSTHNNDIVFAIGPAGTGKTYLAVAVAVAKLKEKQVERIILCRPAVEAGESLGFLPGDLREKVDPYLRPLYDALYDMVPLDKLKRQLETNVIEVVPLAYMRGRTLDNSFVILDEAQNTTSLQMKMFLTRLGANSKAIVTGDITQIDLPPKTQSGLIQITKILTNVDGIDFIYLTDKDVVRHKLVKEIINAYESYSATENGLNNKSLLKETK